MEFLGIGYQELLLILVLALIVLGPERLPMVAYQLGRAVRTLQQYARAVRNEFSDEISYLEEQVRTVKGEVETTRATLREEQARFEAEMRESTAVDLPPLMPPGNGTAPAGKGSDDPARRFGAAPQPVPASDKPGDEPAPPGAPGEETGPKEPPPPMVF